MKRIGYIDGRRVAGFKLAGTAALTGVNLPITDTATPSSGYMRGLYLNYTQSGIKTGTAEINPLAIDVAISANVPYVYPISIYIGASANKTHTLIAALGVYMEDVGNACQHAMCMLLGRNITNVGIATDCFIWMRNHGAVAATAFVKLTGIATYLFDFRDGDLGLPLSESTHSTNVSHKIAVRMPDGSARYLSLTTD